MADNVSDDTHQQTRPSDAAPECPGCIERDKEIKRLKEELAGSSRSFAKPTIRWWCLLMLGLCGLALLTHLGFLLVWLLEELETRESLIAVAYGALYCLPTTQATVLGIIATLLWRPRLQRVGIFLAAASFIGFIAAMTHLAFDSDYGDLLRAILTFLPIATVISVCPTFLLCALYRWTIAPCGQPVTPRPVTLSSCLIFMGLCSVATGVLRWSDTKYLGMEKTSELVSAFIMYVGLPAITTGCIFAILLPAVLQRSRRSWTARVLSLVAVLAVTTAAPCFPLVSIWMLLGVSAETIDSGTVFMLLVLSVGTAATATVVAVACFSWMRLLGYELLTRQTKQVAT